MTLHGELLVNFEPIGQWQARNVTGRRRGINTYACSVRMNFGPTIEFEIEHVREDGAALLASRVLAQAYDELIRLPSPRTPPGAQQRSGRAAPPTQQP